MTLQPGDRLPEVPLMRLGQDGPETVSLAALISARKVVLFGLPGAFTGTCSTAHVPSFIRSAPALREAGVGEIICVSVNDPFVVAAWAEATGAAAAGLTMLADPSGDFARAMGREFTAPAAGLFNRSQRYALLAEDGVVTILNEGDSPGTCDISGGESMLEAMGAEA
ncbi:peroxiredoxin [Pseudoroseicyclus aestuarii]|nr:peroxiredoxin [Pseudoroseicyclus aestuarii]